MAYSINDQALASHYNQFVWGSDSGGTLVTSNNNIYRVWGRGSGNRGMNQSMTVVAGLDQYDNPNLSSPNNRFRAYGVNPNTGDNWDNTTGSLRPVDGPSSGDAAGEIISANHWIGLFSTINRMLYHQNQPANLFLSSDTVTRPMFNGTIKAVNYVQTNIDSCASSTGVGRATTTLVLTNTSATNSWTVPGNTYSNQTRTFDRTCTWNDGNQARWFFNAGGKVRIKVSATSSGDPRSLEMGAIIDGLGTCTIGYTTNTGFSGNDSSATQDLTKGFWTFSNGAGYTQLGKRSAVSGATYTDSYCTLSVKLSGDTSEGSNGAKFDVRLFAYSGYNLSGPAGLDPNWATDGLNITIAVQIEVLDPAYSGGMLTKGWTDPTLG
jgi:hypothetical protein